MSNRMKKQTKQPKQTKTLTKLIYRKNECTLALVSLKELCNNKLRRVGNKSLKVQQETHVFVYITTEQRKTLRTNRKGKGVVSGIYSCDKNGRLHRVLAYVDREQTVRDSDGPEGMDSIMTELYSLIVIDNPSAAEAAALAAVNTRLTEFVNRNREFMDYIHNRHVGIARQERERLEEYNTSTGQSTSERSSSPLDDARKRRQDFTELDRNKEALTRREKEYINKNKAARDAYDRKYHTYIETILADRGKKPRKTGPGVNF